MKVEIKLVNDEKFSIIIVYGGNKEVMTNTKFTKNCTNQQIKEKKIE